MTSLLISSLFCLLCSPALLGSFCILIWGVGPLINAWTNTCSAPMSPNLIGQKLYSVNVDVYNRLPPHPTPAICLPRGLLSLNIDSSSPLWLRCHAQPLASISFMCYCTLDVCFLLGLSVAAFDSLCSLPWHHLQASVHLEPTVQG